jgi:hypothetical protein
MKKILLGMALVLLICTPSWAESSVWKIQKDNSVMYLGGTFHLLRPSDFPLPPRIRRSVSGLRPPCFRNRSRQVK